MKLASRIYLWILRFSTRNKTFKFYQETGGSVCVFVIISRPSDHPVWFVLLVCVLDRIQSLCWDLVLLFLSQFFSDEFGWDGCFGTLAREIIGYFCPFQPHLHPPPRGLQLLHSKSMTFPLSVFPNVWNFIEAILIPNILSRMEIFIDTHFFYRQLGCLALSLRFWVKF